MRKFLSHIVPVLAGIAIMWFALMLFSTVSDIEEGQWLKSEGSGTCYRVAAENRDLPAIREYARDRFLSHGECREIYDIIDRREKVRDTFEEQKKNSLRSFNF